jgi:hypothetical protein
VITTVAFAGAALLLAVSVKVLEAVALAGVNVAVTPAGTPDAARFTALLNPFSPLMLIVAVPLLPCTTLKLPGNAERVKLGDAVTARATEVVADRLPDVPVTVIVALAGAALLLAVNVKVLEVVALAGVNIAVTPAGTPDADKATALLNPFSPLILILAVPLVPCTTLTLPGVTESVKLGAAVTVSATEVVTVRLPEVPVMVTVAFPGAAELLAVSVKVLEVLALAGLNDAVTPAGNPDADKLTALLNPFCPAMLIVAFPLLPCTTLKVPGDAESVKLGGATTLTLIVVAFISVPELPMIVIVAFPTVAPLLAARVNVLELAVLLGLKDAVTPPGKPLTDKSTIPLKAFCGVTLIVVALLLPCATLTLAGNADTVKFGEVGVLIETLSNVALARLVRLPLLVPKPT